MKAASAVKIVSGTDTGYRPIVATAAITLTMPERRHPGDETLFRFAGVTVERDGTTILCDVSAQIPATGVTLMAGPSGSGKTTLLRLCNRLDAPSAGTVAFRGEDVAGLDPLWLRRRVGMVFQRPALFGGTVRDNLLVAAPDANDGDCRRAVETAALDAGLLDRPAATLSGGEAQRACLARTLITRPEVLLLDEPTSALDAGPKLAFEQTATKLAAAGMPLVWVMHDLAQLRRLADYVIALLDGRVAYQGRPGGLERTPALTRFLAEGGT